MTAHIYRRIVATHLLDQLDGATAELAHWLSTGERTTCPRCGQSVPAADDTCAPVRHQLGRVGQPGAWCAS